MRLPGIRESIEALGAAQAGTYWGQCARALLASDQRLLTLRTRLAEHPLVFRANTTDRAVFRQIFIDREFAPLDDLESVGLVVDCGANVGYSAAYFLSRFPGCTVVAVEPEPSTFAVLERNLRPYRGRVEAMNLGVWSHPARLQIVAESRALGAWGIQVREARHGEPADVDAIDIATILRRSDYDRISLLKVDIEGAEAVIFDDAPWLEHVDNIVIELHGDAGRGSSTEIFERAISGRGYRVTRLGEHTICRGGD